MLKETIRSRLKEMQQLHLAAKLDLLSEEEQRKFLTFLSPELLLSQRQKIHAPILSEEFEPISEAEVASEVWAPRGEEQLAQGKVACLILAGGQGSRLGLSIPKALLPIDTKRVLLDVHLEKIPSHVPCVIITSPENHDLIAQFVQNRATLVVQDEAPFLDDNGNWMLRENGRIATGPDGNGHALHLLEKNGILQQWKTSGIEVITIVPIDNPLANPVDPILIGYHAADVTVKVIARQNADEKVGIMVRKKGCVGVQEYSELPDHMPSCPYLAHIGLFALNLSFAEKVSQKTFPWHVARKQDPITLEWIWKFERFIFDMLPYSHKTHLLLYPREKVYAPIKNKNHLETVQRILQL